MADSASGAEAAVSYGHHTPRGRYLLWPRAKRREWREISSFSFQLVIRHDTLSVSRCILSLAPWSLLLCLGGIRQVGRRGGGGGGTWFLLGVGADWGEGVQGMWGEGALEGKGSRGMRKGYFFPLCYRKVSKREEMRFGLVTVLKFDFKVLVTHHYRHHEFFPSTFIFIDNNNKIK